MISSCDALRWVKFPKSSEMNMKWSDPELSNNHTITTPSVALSRAINDFHCLTSHQQSLYVCTTHEPQCCCSISGDLVGRYNTSYKVQRFL